MSLNQNVGPLSIAIFAYNEAKNILKCLNSVQVSCDSLNSSIYVLMNGCTDDTAQIVGAYAKALPNIHPISITLGDKANAWNQYVHVVAPEADIHFFIDGDVMISPGSLLSMKRCLDAHPQATAAAGLPISGRTKDSLRRKLIRNHEMMGNFYALRGGTVAEIRRRGIHLPIGMFGEDGLVTTLIKWDLDPLGPSTPKRIVPCLEDGFYFDSLSPFRPSHWRIYRNRMMRYAIRRQQAQMLYPMLWEQGVTALPVHVVHMYRQRRDSLKLRWNGLNTYFDYIAIKRIKKKIENDDGLYSDEARHYS